MQRTTITLDDDLMARLDEFMADRRYANRSEAIRDLVRSGLEQATLEAAPGRQCLGAAIYVYDHEARELSSRLTRAAHEHHDLSLGAPCISAGPCSRRWPARPSAKTSPTPSARSPRRCRPPCVGSWIAFPG